MKFIFIVLFSVSVLFGAKVTDVGSKFQDSQKCKACHIHLVKDWEKSWHSKSHYKNDEYFRATINYVKRKTRKSLNSVKIKCATCHNPRVSVTTTSADYEIDAVMGFDKDSKINKALESDIINEGINCVVCHNIDKIHSNADETKRGINRIEWTKTGLMSGPYDDASSPYHKVEYRDFMSKKSNQLCFVCHANDRALKGFVFSDMQKEYKENTKLCVDCHMGVKKQGVAATLRIDNGKQRKREIRAHKFSGAHTFGMWKDALELELEQETKNIILTIKNSLPHNIPSGFGSREVIVELAYKSNGKVLKNKVINLTRYYVSKRGKPTIPHLAVKSSSDLSIPANGQKSLKVSNIDGSDEIEVKLYYRLVNDEVRKILKLKEPIWSKKSFITSKSLKLN